MFFTNSGDFEIKKNDNARFLTECYTIYAYKLKTSKYTIWSGQDTISYYQRIITLFFAVHLQPLEEATGWTNFDYWHGWPLKLWIILMSIDQNLHWMQFRWFRDYAVLVEGLWSVILILKAICTYILVVWYEKKTQFSFNFKYTFNPINFFEF